MHIASNGLLGHGGLQTTSEGIWPQIWNQQPWIPWYPYAYCLQRSPRACQPPNNLRGHMTSDLKSATLITLVSMSICLKWPPRPWRPRNNLGGHIWPLIWNQQPWLPWDPCAYCLEPPSRPWWPPNDLGGARVLAEGKCFRGAQVALQIACTLI